MNIKKQSMGGGGAGGLSLIGDENNSPSKTIIRNLGSFNNAEGNNKIE